MSGWIRSQFWYGWRMKGIRISRQAARLLDLPDLFTNPKAHDLALTLLFERAGLIPERSFLVGINQPIGMDATEFMFANAAFPFVAEGHCFPIEDAVVDQERWQGAVHEYALAVGMVQREAEERDGREQDTLQERG